MVCSVCKKNFIRTADLTEYYQTKKEFDNRVSKIIDALTEEDLSKNNDKIWEILLNYDALLLHPNYKPKKCSTETCEAVICNFCYIHKKQIVCLECKKYQVLFSIMNF